MAVLRSTVAPDFSSKTSIIKNEKTLGIRKRKRKMETQEKRKRETEDNVRVVKMISVENIVPNPAQPRRFFTDEALETTEQTKRNISILRFDRML